MQPTLAAAALFCFALSTQALTSTGDRDFGSPPTVEGTVKFDLYQDYLMVARGSADTLKGLTFLIDTGASPSVLDSRLAQKLHLLPSPASIAVVGGSVQAGAAIAPNLNLGPITRENVPVLVEDLSFFEKTLPVRIDAVIGLDVLGQSAFVIDYGARKIHFGTHAVFPGSIPLRLVQGLVVVDAEVNNMPAHMLVDTGASSLLLFAKSMPGQAKELMVSAGQRSSDTIGEFAHRQLSLHSLRLGQAEFRQTPACVVQDPSHEGRGFDGLISPAALGMRRVAIDLARGELGFSR
jgi:predicted aspartyl protease